MSEAQPVATPERNELIDDNARKFIAKNIDRPLLEGENVVSFTLTVDWLEMSQHNESKLAYKKFTDDTVQILLIAKQTVDGDRTAKKEKISEDEYSALLSSSIRHLEKRRHELEYVQNGTTFSLKFDEFADGKLNILEVDAATEEERSAFDAHTFPAALTEVTGDVRYYGYRITDIV